MRLGGWLMHLSPSQRTKTKIAILGAGNMGTAIAQALALQGEEVSIWDHFPEVVREIREQRINRRFLPDIPLDPKIHATRTAVECVMGAGIVFVCVPSAFAGAVLAPVIGFLEKDAVLINVAKGFAPHGNVILPRWLGRLTPGHSWVHLAGPALANEFARGLPTFIVIASESREIGAKVAKALAGRILIPSVTTDLDGAALCGILKNSYAVLMGLLEKLGPAGCNFQSSALVLCGREMASLMIAYGARSETVHGLAGMGDLLATGLAPDSHNRGLGMRLGEGLSLAEIEATKGWLPESVKATPILLALANAHGEPAPLLRCLAGIIAGAKPDADRLMDAFRKAGEAS